MNEDILSNNTEDLKNRLLGIDASNDEEIKRRLIGI